MAPFNDLNQANLHPLLAGLPRALETGENSDMELCLSDGEKVRCHRLVLCTSVPFFANALKPNGFKARLPTFEEIVGLLTEPVQQQESRTGVVEMPNDPPEAIRKMLEYLYGGVYTTEPDTDIPDRLITHADVFVVGEIYDIKGLKGLAQDRLIALLLDCQSSDNWAKAWPAFPTVAGTIYDGVPESPSAEIRRALRRTAATHSDWILNEPDRRREMMEQGAVVFLVEIATDRVARLQEMLRTQAR